mmetsp:Transcript_19272/g.48427  ORF Transcript_19272/g.48427 Transcript_19272/m.48427 type:complete len:332 (-) Transcript_19272:47-1042(-)
MRKRSLAIPAKLHQGGHRPRLSHWHPQGALPGNLFESTSRHRASMLRRRFRQHSDQRGEAATVDDEAPVLWLRHKQEHRVCTLLLRLDLPLPAQQHNQLLDRPHLSSNLLGTRFIRQCPKRRRRRLLPLPGLVGDLLVDALLPYHVLCVQRRSHHRQLLHPARCNDGLPRLGPIRRKNRQRRTCILLHNQRLVLAQVNQVLGGARVGGQGDIVGAVVDNVVDAEGDCFDHWLVFGNREEGNQGGHHPSLPHDRLLLVPLSQLLPHRPHAGGPRGRCLAHHVCYHEGRLHGAGLERQRQVLEGLFDLSVCHPRDEHSTTAQMALPPLCRVTH